MENYWPSPDSIPHALDVVSKSDLPMASRMARLFFSRRLVPYTDSITHTTTTIATSFKRVTK